MNLLIVESPSKIKKLSSILGSTWKIAATVGHISDLPEKELGVDLDTLKPTYETTASQKTIRSLRELITDAEKVYIATDPDREGEAIAHHLVNQFELSDNDYVRVKFSDITEKAVVEAIKHPTVLDQNLIQAQEARRVLDRLIGFLASEAISDFCGTRVTAGRVQSAVLLLICQRMLEIDSFVSTAHFGVKATFDEMPFQWETEEYVKRLPSSAQPYITDRALANEVAKIRDVQISDLDTNVKEVPPPYPFDTASLLSAASKDLGFSGDKTMKVAQRLYEAGLITYMRTDVRNFSDEGFRLIQDHALALGYQDYLSGENRVVTDSSSQEAHEAIRPTTFNHDLEGDQAALMTMIETRSLLSVMSSSYNEVQNIELTAVEPVQGLHPTFTATRSRQIRPGWRVATDKKPVTDRFTEHKLNEVLCLAAAEVVEKTTSPPKLYKEHSLISKLKKLGIGRPSTYASFPKLLIKRSYVAVDSRKYFSPTVLGMTVYQSLLGNFEFMDLNYSSLTEKFLDSIAAGEAKYQDLLGFVFKHLVEDIKKLSTLDPSKVIDVEHEHSCPNCETGYLRLIRNTFWGCSNHSKGCNASFPNYRGSPYLTVHTCFSCNSKLKLLRKQNYFFVCTSKECDKTYPMKMGKPHQLRDPVPTEFTCPCCDSHLMEKPTMRGKLIYPCSSCDFIAYENQRKGNPIYRRDEKWMSV